MSIFTKALHTRSPRILPMILMNKKNLYLPMKKFQGKKKTIEPKTNHEQIEIPI